jgi:hypothetical protein
MLLGAFGVWPQTAGWVMRTPVLGRRASGRIACAPTLSARVVGKDVGDIWGRDRGDAFSCAGPRRLAAQPLLQRRHPGRLRPDAARLEQHE